MAGKGKNEGLSLWYRFWWRTEYLVLHVFGPAELDKARDPHVRMRARREAKVAAAREARLAREAEAAGVTGATAEPTGAAAEPTGAAAEPTNAA